MLSTLWQLGLSLILCFSSPMNVYLISWIPIFVSDQSVKYRYTTCFLGAPVKTIMYYEEIMTDWLYCSVLLFTWDHYTRVVSRRCLSILHVYCLWPIKAVKKGAQRLLELYTVTRCQNAWPVILQCQIPLKQQPIKINEALIGNYYRKLIIRKQQPVSG